MKSIELRFYDALHGGVGMFTANYVYERLVAAGLLVSERDVLCRKLADAYFAYCKRYGYSFYVGLTNPGPERDAVRHAAEALAAYDREHAPKPRYVVRALLAPLGSMTHEVLRDSNFCIAQGTEAECIAVCAALNALAEKEAAHV